MSTFRQHFVDISRCAEVAGCALGGISSTFAPPPDRTKLDAWASTVAKRGPRRTDLDYTRPDRYRAMTRSSPCHSRAPSPSMFGDCLLEFRVGGSRKSGSLANVRTMMEVASRMSKGDDESQTPPKHERRPREEFVDIESTFRRHEIVVSTPLPVFVAVWLRGFMREGVQVYHGHAGCSNNF